MSEVVERVPPFSEDAERALLGSALVDAPSVIPVVRRHYGIRKESFYVPAHQILWEALDEMLRKGDAVDLTTVLQRLADRELLDKVGGALALEQMHDAAGPNMAGSYAEIVRSKYILRAIDWLAREIRNEAHQAESTEHPEKFLSTIPQRFLEIAIDQGPAHDVSRDRVFADVIDEIREMKERQDKIRAGEPVPPLKYISLPWKHLNDQHGGGLRNYLYILGAESSAGKTTMAAQIAESAVKQTGKKVVILSMDADPWEHAARDMSRNSGASLWKLSQGYGRKGQIEAFEQAGERLKKLPIVIDSDSFTLSEQESRLRLEAVKGDIALVIVDYIQLTRLGDHKVDQNENYRLAAVAKRYKQLARELGCPLIALSQINRSAATQSRFAMKSDLRGSGELDEVAHGIWLLYHDRDEKDGRGKVTRRMAVAENHIYPVWVDVVKNKTGPKGMKEFWLYANYFKFMEAEEGEFERCAAAQETGRTYHADGPQEAPVEQRQEEIIL